MAEFKIELNGLPSTAKAALAKIGELASGVSEDAGEDEKITVCKNIAAEFNRMFNSDAAEALKQDV